ncbi:MAG: hypothetical protein EZS28_049099, partial [Streblomastix strix]
ISPSPIKPDNSKSPTKSLNDDPSLFIDPNTVFPCPAEFVEPKTAIFLADTSKTSQNIVSAKWENIVADITAFPPKHFNIRKPQDGLYNLKFKPGYVSKGSIQCILKFTKI